MAKNLIELNGNVYDTRTGKLVSSNTADMPSQEQAPNQATRTNTNTGQQPGLDGFTKRKPTTSRTATPSEPAKQKPQKSQTLMRSAVTKPAPKQPDQSSAKQPFKKHPRMDFTRFERAAKVTKSGAIQRFNKRNTESLSDQPASRPTQENAKPPARPQPQPATFPPSVQPNSASQTQLAQSAQEAKKSFSIDSALKNATSHEQHYYKNRTGSIYKVLAGLKSSSRGVRYSLGAVIILAGVLTAGYFAAPLASVKVASSRSGIAARLPGYTPAGFQLDRSIEYTEGQVALQYDSVSDGRTFRINKESTEWSTAALRNKFVEEKGLYQTITDNGKTIYIYDDSSATWVDNGIWYTIEGASSLNTDQLLRIANSL